MFFEESPEVKAMNKFIASSCSENIETFGNFIYGNRLIGAIINIILMLNNDETKIRIEPKTKVIFLKEYMIEKIIFFNQIRDSISILQMKDKDCDQSDQLVLLLKNIKVNPQLFGSIPHCLSIIGVLEEYFQKESPCSYGMEPREK
jgi:hypothetical protein